MITTRAIVLHSLRYGDDSLIVDMFTESDGRVSFIVKESRSKASRQRRLQFQPLSLLEITFDHRRQLQLQRLKESHFEQPLTTIPFDPPKLSLALFLGEMLWHSLRGEQQNIPLFNYLHSSIEWLDVTDGSVANFHLVFLTHLTPFLGIQPNLEGYTPHAYFDLQDGCFTTAAPLHRHFVTSDNTLFLLHLPRFTYPTMHLMRMNRTERQRVLNLIVEYYRLHMPDFPEPKSLTVLNEVFG